MGKLTDIYNDLLEHNVFLASGSYHLSGECDSIVARTGDRYGIFLDIDKIRTFSQELEAVSHEWAHIKTASTYTFDTPPDVVARLENRADKVQIRRIIPQDELNAAIADGFTEPWELAERFGVSEQLMRRAMFYYNNGYLCQEEAKRS